MHLLKSNILAEESDFSLLFLVLTRGVYKGEGIRIILIPKSDMGMWVGTGMQTN